MRQAAASARRALAALGLAVLAAGAAAQPTKPPVGIYTCTDSQGRRLTADRPIPECAHKEQQVLNGDGSVRAINASMSIRVFVKYFTRIGNDITSE